MDSCPNCNQAVPLDATRCPSCGLPRELPVFDEQGTYLGTGFARPQPPQAPLTPAAIVPPDQANARTENRRSPLPVIIAVGAVAVVLGVAAAVVASQAVVGPPDETVGGPAATATPTPGAPGSAEPSAGPTAGATASASPSPTPEADYEEVFAQVSSGVVQVLASTCDSSGIGSGFLVDERTVVTAYQSVAGAVSVVVRVGTEITVATVEGGDAKEGIAVLTLADPVDGYTFSLADEWPLEVDSSYGSVGVSSGDVESTLTEGEVAELDVESSGDGPGMSGLVSLTGDAEPGLNGGPVVDAEGDVVGVLVDTSGEHEPLARPVDTLADAVSDPGHLDGPDCERPLGPGGAVEITGDRAEDLAPYFTAINAGDYSAAYDHLGPAIRKSTSEKQAAAGWVSTFDFNIRVQKQSGGKVWVTFDSIFAEGKGPDRLTCATWSLDYGLEGSGEDTVITSSLPHSGEPYEPC